MKMIAWFLALFGYSKPQATSSPASMDSMRPPLIVDANGQWFIDGGLITNSSIASPSAAPAALTEDPPMSETNQAAPAPTTNTSDPLLEKLKAVLTTAGHDVEKVWDEAVALAKKLV
jgi:hypothetical protein